MHDDDNPHLSKRVHILCSLFCLITFAGLVYIVTVYHFRFPLTDLLLLVQYSELQFENQLTVGSFFKPMNGHHWHFFSMIFLFIIAHLSNWNILYMTLASLIFPLITIALLYLMSRTAMQRMNLASYSIVFLPPITFITLSYDQTNVWLWGWQVHNHMLTACLAGMIYVLYQKNVHHIHIAIALLCAFIGTYTFALGLLLWPLGFIMIILHDALLKKQKQCYAAIWLIIAALSIIHFLSNDFSTEELYDLYFLQLILYFFNFIGSALAITPFDSTLITGIAFIVFYKIFRLHLTKDTLFTYLPFIILILFALGSAGLTGLARHQYGLMQAFLPRYISFSNMFWLSLMMLIIIHFILEAKRCDYKIKVVLDVYTNVFILLVALGVFFFKIDNFSYRFPQAQEKYVGSLYLYQLACDNELISYYSELHQEALEKPETENEYAIVNFYGPKTFDDERIKYTDLT
ncbi:MAG: hypothetical protein MK137_08580, partial [Rickettsiales bacterium]|nr:hypothetical protein [Rickettsiales bacterium]